MWHDTLTNHSGATYHWDVFEPVDVLSSVKSR